MGIREFVCFIDSVLDTTMDKLPVKRNGILYWVFYTWYNFLFYTLGLVLWIFFNVRYVLSFCVGYIVAFITTIFYMMRKEK